ncbi:MAG: efflux RND transporter periplasmic adaptor subunit [Gammaproteobacteria bacterium]|nr:efflux RND transporter periplasmic adaptor subunit [Gammaproteobacteria bacterium]
MRCCFAAITPVLKIAGPPASYAILLLAGIILSGVSGFTAAAPLNARSVEARDLKSIAIYPQYKAPATVIALNESQLSAEISAIVESIPVVVGQQVNRKEVLVTLRKKDFELALQREEAELKALEARIEFAQYQLQRAQQLKDQQAVSEELLKQRETDLAVLQSERQSRQVSLQQARHNLTKCNIVAPYNAVITEKIASVGELANPGTPLLRIVDAQQREVTAKLQSYQIASLQQAVELYFQDRSNNYSLHLRDVLPVIDPIARTQEVRLTFNDAKTLVGVAGELIWKNRQPHLPPEVLVQREGSLGIFVVTADQRAKFVVLEDAAEGRPAFVALPLNTQIVTKGGFQLHDGDNVSILK